MSKSATFTFKRSHVYGICGFALSVIVFLVSNYGSDSKDLDIKNPTPSPTRTVLIPNQVGVNNWNRDRGNQLEEIRAQNCQLSQELLLQSLDLSRQADELDWNTEGFDNFDQIQNLRNQATSLMLKSQELSNDC